jgi:hypothetical protein
MFPTGYKYFIGAGIILFGFFAIKFPEYQHPIYGYINFGKYHILIGIVFVITGAVYTAYAMHKKNK